GRRRRSRAKGTGADDGARAAAGLQHRKPRRRRRAGRRHLPCTSPRHPEDLGRQGFPRGAAVIGKLSGTLDHVGDGVALVDVNGVGYVVHASNRTLQRLGPNGGLVSLLIETQVREDAINLYGFAEKAERDWFRLLTTVQGVG